MCRVLGVCIALLNMFVACVMSGRVEMDAYINEPIIILYSVLSAAGSSSLSIFVKFNSGSAGFFVVFHAYISNAFNLSLIYTD